MLDTFASLERSNSHRVKREQSLRAFDKAGEATDGSLAGRDLPAFLDEGPAEYVSREEDGGGGSASLFGGVRLASGDEIWNSGDSCHSVKDRSEEDVEAVLPVSHSSPQLSRCVYGGGHGMYADDMGQQQHHRQGRRGSMVCPRGWVPTFTFGSSPPASPSNNAGSSRKVVARMNSDDDGNNLACSESDLPLDLVGRRRRIDGCGWTRRFANRLPYACCHTYCMFVLALSLALVVSGVSYAVVTSTSTGGVVPTATSSSGGTGVHSDYPYAEQDLTRLEAIARRIVDSGATAHTELTGLSSFDSDDNIKPTPQRMAMEWLALADSSKMDPDDDLLLQRYGLAVFWFATHPHLPHRTADDHGIMPTSHHGNMPSGGGSHHKIPTRRRRDRSLFAFDEIDTVGWDPNVAPHGEELQTVVATAAPPTTVEKTSSPTWHHPRANSGGRGDMTTSEKRQGVADLWRATSGWMTGSSVCSWHGVTCRGHQQVAVSIAGLKHADGVTEAAKTPEESSDRLVDNDCVVGLALNAVGAEGELPQEIFTALTELEFLDFSSNQLRGALPDGLGKAKFLRVLNLAENALRGTIPPSLSELTLLRELSLGDNMLSGTIPGEALAPLGETLLGLSLHHNDFDGNLPASLGLLTKVKILYLDSNHLSGWLPTEWSNLAKLQHLYLDGNGALTGVLPPSWGKGMKHLQHLYLSDNKIRGPIPSELGRLWELERLHLRYNRFEGSVPSSLGSIGKLKELTLEGNRLLEGSMPGEVCDLRDPTWGNLEKLTVRCHGMDDASELECDCCTEC